MEERKILFVTTIDPETENGGGLFSRTIRNSISSNFNIHTLVLSNGQIFNNRQFRWIFALIKSIFYLIPPNIIFHSGLLSKYAKRVISEPWDLIFVDHLESSFAVRRFSKSIKIYISHNREGTLIIQKLPKRFAWLAGIWGTWVDLYERRFSLSVEGIISISNQEADWYKKFCSNTEVVYPVFMNKRLDLKKKCSNKSLRLGFLGGYSWSPNREAVDFLFDHVFPHVDRNLNFFLGGNGWQEYIRKKQSLISQLPNLNVITLGFISDISSFWGEIDLFLAPIISGAGINVKICESLANEIPVLALNHAVRGLPDRVLNSAGLNVASTNLEFASLVESFSCGCNFVPPYEFSDAFAIKAVNCVIENVLCRSGILIKC